MEQQFTPLAALPRLLPDWYAAHHRDLPWRRDQEPYHVWVSEIMLQQTRVEAVKGYYARFLSRLPGISDLAEVPEPELIISASIGETEKNTLSVSVVSVSGYATSASGGSSTESAALPKLSGVSTDVSVSTGSTASADGCGAETDSAASDTLCDCAPQPAAMDASKDSSRMVITLFFFIFSRLSPVDGCTFCKRPFESYHEARYSAIPLYSPIYSVNGIAFKDYDRHIPFAPFDSTGVLNRYAYGNTAQLRLRSSAELLRWKFVIFS